MSADAEEIRALTRELDPQAVLAGYRVGLFPMGLGEGGAPPYAWWSPEIRGVLEPGGLHVSRSLRRSLRGFRWSVDTCFDEVLAACADPSREGAWIDPGITAVYRSLHEQGHAHSIEVWDSQGLAGGLYGIGIGAFFAGESKFHHRTDASKAALVALRDLMTREFGNIWLMDTQWSTSHLASLGVSELDRWHYIPRLAAAIGRGDSWGAHMSRTPQMNFYAA